MQKEVLIALVNEVGERRLLEAQRAIGYELTRLKEGWRWSYGFRHPPFAKQIRSPF